MMRFSAKLLVSIIPILSLLVCTSSARAESTEMTCYVDGTDDLFKAYPRQQVFASDRFAIYQLIDGLTVLVINKQTMRFNRLSNLNLLAESTLDPEMPPEPYQYFTGSCR